MTNILVPDISAALNQTIFGTDSQPFTDPTRIPMSFTSTKRLRLLNTDFAGTLEAFTDATTRAESTSGSSLQQSFGSDMPVITMKVNPHTIKFSQPKRITKRDTREGSVYYHFTNNKGQNNDILVVSFNGNTGNIDIRGDAKDTQGVFSTQAKVVGVGAVQKQLIWHNLWKLTREEMILDDNTINTFQIMYSSPIIPVQIALLGFFSTVMEWTDSAEKPFSKDYSFSFTVQETVPPLDELLSTIQSVTFDPNKYLGLV